MQQRLMRNEMDLEWKERIEREKGNLLMMENEKRRSGGFMVVEEVDCEANPCQLDMVSLTNTLPRSKPKKADRWGFDNGRSMELESYS